MELPLGVVGPDGTRHLAAVSYPHHLLQWWGYETPDQPPQRPLGCTKLPINRPSDLQDQSRRNGGFHRDSPVRGFHQDRSEGVPLMRLFHPWARWGRGGVAGGTSGLNSKNRPPKRSACKLLALCHKMFLPIWVNSDRHQLRFWTGPLRIPCFRVEPRSRGSCSYEVISSLGTMGQGRCGWGEKNVHQNGMPRNSPCGTKIRCHCGGSMNLQKVRARASAFGRVRWPLHWGNPG